MRTIDDDDIRAVLDRQQDRLLALPHVVATGIVDRDGAPGRAIALYVDQLGAAELPTSVADVVRGEAVSVPTAIRLMGTLSF